MPASWFANDLRRLPIQDGLQVRPRQAWPSLSSVQQPGSVQHLASQQSGSQKEHSLSRGQLAGAPRRIHWLIAVGLQLDVDDLVYVEVVAELFVNVDQAACALELVEDDGA